jgi:hypothetical protein
MKWIGIVLASVALAYMQTSAATAATVAASAGPIVDVEDVDSFYKLYNSAEGHPTAEQLQDSYLDPGSDGLHRLAQLRHVTGVSIREAIVEHPQIYASAKRCMAVLPRVRRRVATALHRLGLLYPEAQFPPVTIAVGRGKPVGVTDDKGVMIGLEALCAVTWMEPNVEDRFVHVVAHEYAHVQQALAAPDLYNDPDPTVLEESLIEGAAEFAAELISGSVSYTNLKRHAMGREKVIETAFLGDEDKTDLSEWLYNGTLTKPGDLGYWVGYRIVKSYYLRAADKRRALRDILQMADPKQFVLQSGWYPGIRLQ